MSNKNPIATITMNSGKKIVIELFPKFAPNTVNSFISLANKELFNNREIKRIVKDFVVQPSYTSFEDPKCEYSLEGEFKANNFDNPLTITKWTVAMGGDGVKEASGSCFFFSMGHNEERLDGKYSGFGTVIEGFDELLRIEQVETSAVDIGVEGVSVNLPVIPEIMTTVEVETFGVSYPEPVKMIKEKV